jgi:hypothetical protein
MAIGQTMNENKTNEPTPDQLLRMLDVQIAMQRDKRKNTTRNRAIVLVGGIMIILGGAFIALVILMQRLQDMPRGPVENDPAAPTQTAP